MINLNGMPGFLFTNSSDTDFAIYRLLSDKAEVIVGKATPNINVQANGSYKFTVTSALGWETPLYVLKK